MGAVARKPRDIDAELKALQDKAKALKAKRLVQFGELVVATGADAFDAETLAGVLMEAIERSKQSDAKEGWRRRGAAFFLRRPARKSTGSSGEPDADRGVDNDGAAKG
jgi:hypothetical protein